MTPTDEAGRAMTLHPTTRALIEALVESDARIAKNADEDRADIILYLKRGRIAKPVEIRLR